MKCTVQEAKFPVKNFIRQCCGGGFNSGIKELMGNYLVVARVFRVDVIFEI
jgi:hypothetical protein